MLFVSTWVYTRILCGLVQMLTSLMLTLKNINSGCFLSFLWQSYLIQLVCSPPYLLNIKSFKILLLKALTYILTIGKELWHFREQISIFSSPVPLLLWKAESWMLLKGEKWKEKGAADENRVILQLLNWVKFVSWHGNTELKRKLQTKLQHMCFSCSSWCV